MPKETIQVVIAETDTKQSGIRQSPQFTYGLRPQVLGNFDTLAQSISALAPTGTPAILIPLVFSLAGNGAWLAYLIATAGVILVGCNINQFASRSASPGSVYSYAAIGLGPGMGMLTGWSLLCGYIVCLSCIESQFTVCANSVLKEAFHLSVSPILIMLFCAVLAGYIAWRDIKLSSSLMLVLEIFSISLILILMVITVWHRGYIFDWSQIRLVGVSAQSLSLGLVFALFGFTGFEAATSLGAEAKDPLNNIPKAVIRSGLWSGLFFMVCAYVMVLGFSGSVLHLDKSETPLISLAVIDGVPFLGIILSCGAVISFFACFIACVNVASRLIFMMGHHGIFHSSFSEAHESNHTPHIAVIVATILGIIPGVFLYMNQCTLMDIIAWTGTFGAYCFIFCYLLVSLAAPVYLYRLNSLRMSHIVVALLSVITMSAALLGNINPHATGVEKWLPYMFGALMAIGITWYFLLKRFSPEIIESMTADMEAIRQRFVNA